MVTDVRATLRPLIKTKSQKITPFISLKATLDTLFIWWGYIPKSGWDRSLWDNYIRFI